MTLTKASRTNLRAAIKAHPLPTKAICFKAGYNYAHVRKVISGARANPTLQFVEAMAGALGVDPLDLMKNNGDTDDCVPNHNDG